MSGREAASLKSAQLQARGYVFVSQTDTEVIAHLVDSLYEGDLFAAVHAATHQLHGAYAIAVFCKDEPHRVIGARAGSPLVGATVNRQPCGTCAWLDNAITPASRTPRHWRFRRAVIPKGWGLMMMEGPWGYAIYAAFWSGRGRLISGVDH